MAIKYSDIEAMPRSTYLVFYFIQRVQTSERGRRRFTFPKNNAVSSGRAALAFASKLESSFLLEDVPIVGSGRTIDRGVEEKLKIDAEQGGCVVGSITKTMCICIFPFCIPKKFFLQLVTLNPGRYSCISCQYAAKDTEVLRSPHQDILRSVYRRNINKTESLYTTTKPERTMALILLHIRIHNGDEQSTANVHDPVCPHRDELECALNRNGVVDNTFMCCRNRLYADNLNVN
uniref:Uncharacterized protein n=1 Tax=Glossina pallidipes TaxID=7398 RepID=A0A1A9ZD91_GLOPL